MTGFAFADDSSTEAETPADNDEAVSFVSNETGDLYLTSVDYEQVTFAVMKAAGYDALKVYSDDTLEDLGRLRDEHSEAHSTQVLHMIAVLFKSTAGKLQLDNDHSAGLIDSKAPESHDEVQSDHSYALHSKDLPTINWSGLTDEESEKLEDMGIKADQLGFDTTVDGPKLLSVHGERLPIAATEGHEIEGAIDILQDVPDTPSTYDEDDGLIESSDPSVFGEGDEVEPVVHESDEDSGSDDSKYPDFNLAENPDRVNEVQVKALRGHNGSPDRLHVSKIDSRRTVQTMLSAEADADNTRKGAMKRLKERRSSLKGGDEDQADNEEQGIETLAKQFDFSDIQKDAMEFRVESGRCDSYKEAAREIADI